MRVPTEEQTRAFADYVACVQRGNKHLPAFPPGQPFVFYLDPFAGFVSRRYAVGAHKPWIEVVEDWSQCTHNMLPTPLYREKFGCWRHVVLNWDIPDTRHVIPSIIWDGWAYELPDELIQRGTCRLTTLLDDTGALVNASVTELTEKLSELLWMSPEPAWDHQITRYIHIIRYLLRRVRNDLNGRLYEFLPAATTVRSIHHGLIERAPCCGDYEDLPAPLLTAVREEHRFQNHLLLETLLRLRKVYTPLTPRELKAPSARCRI